MRRLLTALALSLMLHEAAAVSVHSFRGGDAADKEAYSSCPYKPFHKYPEDKGFLCKLIVLHTPQGNLPFLLQGDVVDGKWGASLGPWLSPGGANWYSNGGVAIDVPGRSGADARLTELDDGFKVSWVYQDLAANVEVSALDGNKVFVQAYLEAVSPPPSFTLSLRAYPSSFGGDYESGKRLRQREGLTKLRTLRLADSPFVLGKDERWALLYDKYFDYAENRGGGPCAFIFNPKQTLDCVVTVGNYACEAKLRCPGSARADVVLLDFKNWGNAAAANYMGGLELSPP